MAEEFKKTHSVSADSVSPEAEEKIPLASGARPPVVRGRNAGEARPSAAWPEILCLLLLVILADLTIYRAYGFAGYAAFFLLAPLLLWIGAPLPRHGKGFWLVRVMLVLLIVKLLWCGSWLLAGIGAALLVAFAMALVGLRPYILEIVVFAIQSLAAGFESINVYRRSGETFSPLVKRVGWLSFFLPLAAVVAFGLLFIVANPDLFVFFGETFERVLTAVRQWVLHYAPDLSEIVFWLITLWIAIGLLRPMPTRPLMTEASSPAGAATADPVGAALYAPFRNTLVTVIVLFAVYLVFEFQTLWFRVFPEGFHYSGYAHEGAAWLTVALALASAVLSFIFRGQVLDDPRLPRLRRLAWIWSVENLLLALAVYNRLSIYVGFNGMTRMRMVGIFGTSCVVAGLLIVVWKIVRRHGFVWLIHRQLWALALTVYLFALTPVDAIVTGYNVRRIMAGDPAPSVEISVHPIGSEGVLLLLPLVECDNEIIRQGIRALLAQRHDEAEARARRNRQQGWTTYQIADRRVLEKLRANGDRWAEYADLPRREAALARFHEYAYQWY